MGLMALGSKLRGENFIPPPPPHDIVGEFAAVLERSEKEGLIRDVSELPYKKKVIEPALQHCIKEASRSDSWQNSFLESLKVGYLSLADFQPLTAKERDALSVRRNFNRF